MCRRCVEEEAASRGWRDPAAKLPPGRSTVEKESGWKGWKEVVGQDSKEWTNNGRKVGGVLVQVGTKPEEERESEGREVDTKVEEEFHLTDGLVRALGVDRSRYVCHNEEEQDERANQSPT